MRKFNVFFHYKYAFRRFFANKHKILSLVIFCLMFSGTIIKGNEKVVCHVPVAGSLIEVLTSEQKKTVKELIISGELDVRDFKCMRDELPFIKYIDIEQVLIKSYQGNGGTVQGKKDYLMGEVPENSFYKKIGLKSIKLPSSANSIGDYTFYGCKLLEKLFIHKDVSKIGNFALVSCENLKNLDVSEENKSFSTENGILFNKNKTVLIQANFNETGIYVIPATVLKINNYAFYSNKYIKEVWLSENLQRIGYASFMYCTNLTSINIPLSLDYIVDYAFAYCSNLKLDVSDVKLKAQIGPYAFFFCNQLTGVLGIEKLSIISPWSFFKCEKLESLQFRDNQCSSIGEYAFSENVNLKGTITFPESVKVIKKGAFSGCKKISQLIFNSKDIIIENGAFRNCEGISGQIVFPSHLREIRSFSFSNCKEIKSIILPDSLKRISNFAFKGCNKINDVLLLPNSLELIEQGAFQDCKSISKVVFSGFVKRIENNAFRNCHNIEEIQIHADSIASIKIDLLKVFSSKVLSNCKLKVPKGSVGKFKKSSWNLFYNISEI
jgi:hypothetical protein